MQIHSNGEQEKVNEKTTKGDYENILGGYCCPAAISARRRRQANAQGGQNFITQYKVNFMH